MTYIVFIDGIQTGCFTNELTAVRYANCFMTYPGIKEVSITIDGKLIKRIIKV